MRPLKVGPRPTQKRKEKEALHNLRLALIFKGISSSELPFAILVPFYQHYGLSNAEILTLLGAAVAVGLVMEVPSGWFADRYGRKRSMLMGATLHTTSYVIYG